MDADLHEQLQPVAFLLGTWCGRGRGRYPTIPDFTYAEEAVFSHTGRPFLVYSQRTWNPETKQPMHSESGFIRVLKEGTVEAVISHAFGVAELAEGAVSGSVLTTTSTSLTSTASAKIVEGVTRRFERGDRELRYEIGMAFGGHPMQGHLEAMLTHTED